MLKYLNSHLLFMEDLYVVRACLVS